MRRCMNVNDVRVLAKTDMFDGPTSLPTAVVIKLGKNIQDALVQLQKDLAGIYSGLVYSAKYD